MKYILVKSLVEGSCYSFGGIIDIEKTSPTPEEAQLIGAVVGVLNDPNSEDMDVVDSDVLEVEFEALPFTGTIEGEVTLYIE